MMDENEWVSLAHLVTRTLFISSALSERLRQVFHCHFPPLFLFISKRMIIILTIVRDRHKNNGVVLWLFLSESSGVLLLRRVYLRIWYYGRYLPSSLSCARRPHSLCSEVTIIPFACRWSSKEILSYYWRVNDTPTIFRRTTIFVLEFHTNDGVSSNRDT